ncbi:MAG TPA: LPS-assembly protein LptD [Burkholderiales bacterium]|jgi:LPS-assembly protein|nr:LPS-assembly protein LptD [Burkholderiales bacterium]
MMRHFPARVAALMLSFFACAQLGWAQAPAPNIPGLPQPREARPPAKPKPKTPTTIEAERIEGVAELEVTARGRVEFKREDLSIYSEFLRYNQEFGRVEADGGVRMLRAQDRFFGPRLRYNTQDDTGVFEGSNFILQGQTQTMRVRAERTEFLGKSRYRMTRGAFTSCEPGREDWRIEAREMTLDRDTEVGSVRDGRLKFFDTTILALPFGSFSLDHQRKSGFLAPYYSQNSRRGFEFAVPYYLNLAPEYDATIVPSYMTKRGGQLKTEMRWIDPTYSGEARIEHMPEDQVLHRSRSAFSLLHTQQFTPQLYGRLDVNKVTDARYFVDLSSRVNQVSTGVLQQMGLLTYGGALASNVPFSVVTQVQRFQTLQDPLAPITPPYDQLPRINFSTGKTEIAGRFDLLMPAEFVRFSHPFLVEGTRLRLTPVLSAPYLAPGYFITPKVGMHYASYRLDRAALGQSDRPSVTVPWMSLDSGLVFDRNVRWFGQSLTQTLEPRLFYVYAPFRRQNEIPTFDTAVPDFNFVQLFSENRFTGGDRFGDANQVTLAATSRMLTSNGEELLRATIGQRYYFSDERVALNATTPLRTRGTSDLLASVGGRIAKALTFDATVQYDQAESRAQRYGVSARYAPEIAKVISARYGYNRDTQIKQVDIAGQWPVRPGWYAIGRFNYSILDRRLLEGIAGVEYNAGCWVFRAAIQRLQAAAQTTSSGIFFMLEFNGVGSIGSDDIITLLRRSVPGYAITNPTDPHLIPPSVQRPLPFPQAF